MSSGGRIKRSASKTTSYVADSSSESDGNETDESEVYSPAVKEEKSAAPEKKKRPASAKKGGASVSASRSVATKSRKRKAEKEAEPLTEAQEELFSKELPAEYKNMIPLPKVLQGKQERDIKKKGKRKNKFLFCLPGQVALSGNAELGPIENIEPDQPIGLGGGAARIV